MTITLEHVILIVTAALMAIGTIGGFWVSFSRRFQTLETKVEVTNTKLDAQHEEDVRRRSATADLYEKVEGIGQTLSSVDARLKHLEGGR